MGNIILYIVIPCYNEQEVLSETAKVLSNEMTALVQSAKISPDSKIMFVNDKSKHLLKKKLAFAIDRITSLNIKPITLITKFGLVIFFLSLVILIWVLAVKFTGRATTVWSSILASICMLKGFACLQQKLLTNT